MAVAPAPRGLDGALVMLEPAPDTALAVEMPAAALVSRVDAAAYTPDVVEARVGDVEWVGPRAEAHDAVLTWASEQDAVVPFPTFTLYASAESLYGMLRERGAVLNALLQRVTHADEWSVRLFRLDDQMAAVLTAWSPAMAELERQAGAAILDAAFLVHRDRGAGFRATVAELGRTLEPRGLRIELSGPWPPYHFVREPS